MSPARCIMGIETEYAVADYGTSRGPGERLTSDFLEYFRKTIPNVSDGTPEGMFLGNGARLYHDCGHPEMATAECESPRDLLACVRAGERLMAEAASAIGARRGTSVGVLRTNIDYSTTRTTFGTHESFSHRTNPTLLPDRLIPHLVTRLVYCGAGGYNPLSIGAEFTLSPRSWLLEVPISTNSTSGRGIFHVKDEALGVGLHRLHLLCGESLCTDLAVLLRAGTTALIVATIDAGGKVGEGLALASSMQALRTVATDTSCSAILPLANGHHATAVEIQRQYLATVEASRQAGQLPEWAGEICALWAEVLDHLERRDGWVQRSVDWGIKEALYRRWCRSDEVWEGLPRWTGVLRSVRACVAKSLAKSENEMPVMDIVKLIGPESPIAAALELLDKDLLAWGVDRDNLRQFLQFRAQLFEIDLRFGRLGSGGTYAALERGGIAGRQFVGEAQVQAAAVSAPGAGRAALRGAFIRQLHHDRVAAFCVCDWTRLADRRNNRFVDLNDPLCREASWQGSPETSRGPMRQFLNTLQRDFF